MRSVYDGLCSRWCCRGSQSGANTTSARRASGACMDGTPPLRIQSP